jgi:membrane protein DedA with SNARE-associated domain
VTEWVTSFVESVGLPGIFVLMVLEIPVPVIQSEIVMTFSGFTASRGQLNVVAVLLAGVAGSQIGSIGLFALARRVSERRVNDLLARYGGWLGFHRDNLERGQDFFRRHDQWAVLIGRLLPGLRSFIAVPAGMQRMPLWRFFLLNLVGTAFWVSVLTYLGWVLGDNYSKVDQYSSYFTYAVLGGIAAYVLYRLVLVGSRRIATD